MRKKDQHRHVCGALAPSCGQMLCQQLLAPLALKLGI